MKASTMLPATFKLRTARSLDRNRGRTPSLRYYKSLTLPPSSSSTETQSKTTKAKAKAKVKMSINSNDLLLHERQEMWEKKKKAAQEDAQNAISHFTKYMVREAEDETLDLPRSEAGDFAHLKTLEDSIMRLKFKLDHFLEAAIKTRQASMESLSETLSDLQLRRYHNDIRKEADKNTGSQRHWWGVVRAQEVDRVRFGDIWRFFEEAWLNFLNSNLQAPIPQLVSFLPDYVCDLQVCLKGKTVNGCVHLLYDILRSSSNLNEDFLRRWMWMFQTSSRDLRDRPEHIRDQVDEMHFWMEALLLWGNYRYEVPPAVEQARKEELKLEERNRSTLRRVLTRQKTWGKDEEKRTC